MNSMLAFAKGQASKDKPVMVFDWDKAAKIIKERGASNASAGLAGDWEYTGGDIFTDGEPNMEDYTYLASTWATPQLGINGEIIDCWRYRKETKASEEYDWDASTKWPESAVKILKG